MEKKNNDILKKGLMETKVDFTSNLMDRINAEEKAMSTVLSENGVLETSPDFTIELMSKLDGKVPAKPYSSVISKQAWIGIAAVFFGVIVLALMTTGQEGTGLINYNIQMEVATNSFVSFFKNSPIFTYSSLGLLILTVGLLFEQRLRKTV